MFNRACTAAVRNVTICGQGANHEIVGAQQLLRKLSDGSAGVFTGQGGMIAFTRERPAARPPSAPSSMRRPIGATMRLMMPRSCSMFRNRTLVSWSFSDRST